jgi:hypothetical protein
MTEKLIVRNFGPIKQADIEVRDLTVFVGPQATGKSMTAQILYFMRGFEELSSQSFHTFLDRRRRGRQTDDVPLRPDQETPSQSVMSTLEWWYGNEISVYATSDTLISWNPLTPSKDTEYEIRWDQKKAQLNEPFKKRLSDEPRSPGPQTYIPAGRALYSFLPPSAAIRLLSPSRYQMQWPGYVITFYEALGGAITQLWRDQEKGQQTLFDSILRTDFVESRMDAIIKGQIRYGPDVVLLQVGKQKLRPETIAAGQIEIWPFWAILQETLKSGYLNRARIYFEEPEAHLHPGAQRGVVEVIAYLIRQGRQFVITTHSPYILYAINNSLMAQQVLDKGKELPPGIPQEIALRADQVAAYRFSPDGQVHDIMDAEVGLIDESELDQVADELGMTFTDLQEWLEDAE